MSSRLHALALALSLIAIASVVASYEVAERRLDLIQTRLEAVEAKLEKPSAFPVQLVDSLGRSVVIVNEPKRIVSIAPSTTEILFAIGAGEKVVGVDRFSNYPPDVVELARAGKIQYVGDFINPSIETILKLRPDLVVGTGGVQARHIEALASRGLTVLALDAENLEELYRCILLLGVATGESERARALVEELKANLSLIESLSSGAPSRPTALLIVWVEPIYAAGGASWINDLIEIAGGINVLANVSTAWPQLSVETLLRLDPDVVILTEHAGGLANSEQALSWLRSLPGGGELKAVKSGRVYMVHGDLNDAFSRPSPRVPVVAASLLAVLHPELLGVGELPKDLSLSDVVPLLWRVVNATTTSVAVAR